MTGRRRALRPDRGELIAAAASAGLFAIAFPPFPLLVPAFVCLLPAAIAIVRRADAGVPGGALAAARIGFWFGLLGYGANLYWIAIALSIYTKLAILGYLASLLVLAPVVSLAGAALYLARRATRWPLAVLLPVTWTASELVLNYMHDLAFPWLPLGLAIAPLPLLAQIADLSGARGISFWIAATGGLLADALMVRADARAAGARWGWREAARPLAAIAVLAAIVAAYGAWRLRTTVVRPLAPVAVIQPNIPQFDKWQEEHRDRIVGMLASLTRAELARSDPRLVVWPEAALPGFMQEHPEWRDTIRALVGVERAPLLFGVLDLEWRGPEDFDYYNAAMFADSTGLVGAQPAYHKERLVPIVERVPLINPRWFSGLRYFGAFGEGTGPVVYRTGFGRVGVLICYESIFPQISRANRRDGVDVLLNITNDAWFGRSLAPHQHFAHLQLRAIETRVGVVRSANTGISGYVDPLGRVRDATPIFVPRTATYTAETTDVRTPYVRFGDWLGILCLAATVALVAWSRVAGRRSPRPSTLDPRP